MLSIILLTLVGDDFLAALPGDQRKAASGGRQIFLLGSNFAASIWAIWLYTAIRPRYGPGAKTAVVTGSAWWFHPELAIVNATLGPLAGTLPAIIVAMLAGVWLYEKSPRKDPPSA